MNRPSLVLALLIIPLLFSATPLQGRVERIWSYNDLMLESDLVAVVEPIKNENNSDQWEWDPKIAQGVTTTFKVLCVLHGPALSARTILVRHFVYTDGIPLNGGTMINFLVAPLNLSATIGYNGKSEPWDFKNTHPTWLAFLKKAPDGTFVPTSGQIDPDFSFHELHPALMFDPTHGMIH